MQISDELRDEWPATGLPPLVSDLDRISAADNIFTVTSALAQRKIDWIKRGLKRPVEISFVYLDSDEFGAWAVPVRSGYVVAVSAGTLVSLLTFTARLFSAWIPAEQRWVRKPYPADWQPAAGTLIDAWRRGAVIPSDYETSIRSVILARRIAAFILDHELAHILLGHCDLDYRGLGPYRIDAAISAQAEEDALLSQAMELEADRFAALMSVDPVLGVPDVAPAFQAVLEQSNHDPEVVAQLERFKSAMGGLIGSRNSEVFSTLLSQYSMFRLFEDHHWSESTLDTASHPPSPMRFAWAVQAMTSTFQTLGDGASLAAVRRADKRIKRSAERVFAVAVGRSMNGQSFEAARSRAAAMHRNKLLQASESLKLLLTPLYGRR